MLSQLILSFETVLCLVGCLAAYLACITRCRYHPANCERQKCLLTLPNLWGEKITSSWEPLLYINARRLNSSSIGRTTLRQIIIYVHINYFSRKYTHISTLINLCMYTDFIYIWCVYNTQHFSLFFQKLLQIFSEETITSQPGNVLLWSNEAWKLCVCVSELAQFSAFCTDFYWKWVLLPYQETHCLQTKFTNVTSNILWGDTL